MGVATGVALRASLPTQAIVHPADNPYRTLRAALSGAASATLLSKKTYESSPTVFTRCAFCASFSAKASARCAGQSPRQSTTTSQHRYKIRSLTTNRRHNHQRQAHQVSHPQHPQCRFQHNSNRHRKLTCTQTPWECKLQTTQAIATLTQPTIAA